MSFGTPNSVGALSTGSGFCTLLHNEPDAHKCAPFASFWDVGSGHIVYREYTPMDCFDPLLLKLGAAPELRAMALGCETFRWQLLNCLANHT